MTDWDQLHAAVGAAYDAEEPPSWPDPHPRLNEPTDEEYSRVTEPDRYRIVHARARAWRDTLAELPGVSIETAEPGTADRSPEQRIDQRSFRIRSSAPGALDLILLEQDVPLDSGQGVLPVLRIALHRPILELGMYPGCGCDACDDGSLDLVNAIDEAIRRIVVGPFVVLRGGGWGAHWSPGHTSSHGTENHEEVVRLCEGLATGIPVTLPRRTEAFVGHSWF